MNGNNIDNKTRYTEWSYHFISVHRLYMNIFIFEFCWKEIYKAVT